MLSKMLNDLAEAMKALDGKKILRRQRSSQPDRQSKKTGPRAPN